MAIMKRRAARPTGEIPTASMADIAFLLLIFFLVTTTFDEDRGLRIVLPAPGEQVEVTQKNVLHLLVQTDGMVQIRRGDNPQTELQPASAIGAIWRQEAARNPSLIAAVKTAPQAPYRYMVDVLDQLQSARADKISLQIQE
jgi:biopolymer transport protein ExbD